LSALYSLDLRTSGDEKHANRDLADGR